MKFKLAIGSAILLAIAFIINSAFLRSTLTDGYQVSEIKRFLIQIESASNTIEKTLADNKRLSIIEMRELLNRQRQVIVLHQKKLKASDLDGSYLGDTELVNLSIVLRSGSKLVTTANEGTEIEAPVELVEQILEITNGDSSAGLEFVENNDSYFVPHPLFDNQGRWIVSLVFQFQKEALRNVIAPRLDRHIFPTLIVGIFSVFGIWFLYFKLAFKNRVNTRKDFVTDFVLVMLATLSLSLIVNAVIFESQILKVSKANAREASTEISNRLDHRLSLKNSGQDYQKQRFDFSETFSLFDNFEAIILTNSHGTPVYRHQDNNINDPGSESTFQSVLTGRLSEQQLLVSEKLTTTSPGNRLSGNIFIHISKNDIVKASLSMLTNGITILFITTLVMVECLLLYLHLLSKEKRTDHRKLRYELGFIRPAMFLFLFAIDLSMSFVPLHMQSFDADLFGLARNIVLGLPISAEFLCVGIFLLIAGVWMDRRGWHEPFFVGLFIVGTGSLCSWMATDAFTFILSRALVGVGYGLTLMSAQGLIVSFGGKNGRALGFASLFAGLYSGSICGAAAGAFLAERFGYETVFFMGAVMVLILIIFSLVFMHSLIRKTHRSSEPEEKPKHKIRLKPLLKFIGNPIFISLSVLSSLPASIAVAGFLHFFTPVYLDQIGARESTIGQALILYGICLIYFGPLVGRFIDRSQNKKYYMLTGGMLGGLAFITFSTDFGLASMILSIFLLGLSSSFVLSSQSTMILELKESQQLGEGTALGIFRSISRIGQVIGPLIFGWVLLSGDLNDAINYLGFTYVGAMVLLTAFVMNRSTNLEDQKAKLA